jgi:catechol 2,3-dioxygenase-like lactoylglutathione lyase family enzyme
MPSDSSSTPWGSTSLTTHRRPRTTDVRSVGSSSDRRGPQTGLLLAEADGEQQVDAIDRQYAGRVGLFLRVDDFEAARRRMLDHGVEFVTEPRDEPYGRFAVFLDLSGNRWDLLGPPST